MSGEGARTRLDGWSAFDADGFARRRSRGSVDARVLHVHGLTPREAGRLRDALARAEVRIDEAAEEGTVRIIGGGNGTSPQQVLLLLRQWARRDGIAQLPILYGESAYVLSAEERSATS